MIFCYHYLYLVVLIYTSISLTMYCWELFWAQSSEVWFYVLLLSKFDGWIVVLFNVNSKSELLLVFTCKLTYIINQGFMQVNQLWNFLWICPGLSRLIDSHTVCWFYSLQDQILRLMEENGSLKQNLLSTNAAHGAPKTILKVVRLVETGHISVLWLPGHNIWSN